MIAKIQRGSDTVGLLRYLYGPGEANEHEDPHLVAAWTTSVAVPGEDPTAINDLARQLDTDVLRQTPFRHAWHCTIRASSHDPPLSDAEWARTAQRIVTATGIAPDHAGCRWIAVRHDGTEGRHIHIVATLARKDGQRPRIHNDAFRARGECRTIENELGLWATSPADNTASVDHTRGELDKAARHGWSAPARRILAERVRTVASTTRDVDEFLAGLEKNGTRVRVRQDSTGSLVGYAVALPGDRNLNQRPVWYGGAKLAPDLSLPRIKQRFAGVPAVVVDENTAEVWERSAHLLSHTSTELASQSSAQRSATASAVGDVLTAMSTARSAPSRMRLDLADAARPWERAGRLPGRWQDHSTAVALRRAGRAISSAAARPDDDEQVLQQASSTVAATLLVVSGLLDWYTQSERVVQAQAATRTRESLTAAHQHAYPATDAQEQAEMATLAREALTGVPGVVADDVVDDPAWPALAGLMRHIQRQGENPEAALREAAQWRELEGARSVTQILLWRMRPNEASETRDWSPKTAGPREAGRSYERPAQPGTRPRI